MKNINEQDIRDIELTEDELDQVQGGIGLVQPLGVYAIGKLAWLIAKNFRIIGLGGGHRF